ncbi:MAG: hypothetical protein KDK64_03535 [Chlamydiia bacterium]|nr:hypothetical protein [Chlamydiia bacterium]
MKRILFGLGCLMASLSAASFHDEFLDEVLKMAAMNPTEIMGEEQEFLRGFYQESRQETTEEDAKVRPVYVAAQGDFERTMAYFLSQGKIQDLVGWIHTPTPATPLCTEGEISPGLVDETMAQDRRRLFTVMKRPDIIRNFLKQGGALVAYYPEAGWMKRSEEQQKIFEDVRKAYPRQLIDGPLPVLQLPEDMVGATYVFSTAEGQWYAFAIQATQANAPENDRTWVMWFGSLDDPEVHARVERVNCWIRTNGAPQTLSDLLYVEHLQ